MKRAIKLGELDLTIDECLLGGVLDLLRSKHLPNPQLSHHLVMPLFIKLLIDALEHSFDLFDTVR